MHIVSRARGQRVSGPVERVGGRIGGDVCRGVRLGFEGDTWLEDCIVGY